MLEQRICTMSGRRGCTKPEGELMMMRFGFGRPTGTSIAAVLFVVAGFAFSSVNGAFAQVSLFAGKTCS
jgi:hypothetical protein